MKQVPFTDFAPKIHVVKAECEPKDIVPIIQKWMRFKLFWPRQSLNPEILAQNLKLYYVPCWSIDWMEASGRWFGKFRYEQQVDGGYRPCSNCNGSGRQYLGGGVGDCKECGGSGQHEVTVKIEKEDFGSGDISITVRNLLLPKAKEVRALFENKFEKDWTKPLPTDVTELDILEPDISQSAEDSALALAEEILMNEFKKNAAEKFEKEYDVSAVKEASELSILKPATKLGMVTAIAYPTYIGTYTHEGKEYGIQIDAPRGRAHVEISDAIMGRLRWVRIGLMAIFAILVGALFFCCRAYLALGPNSQSQAITLLAITFALVVAAVFVGYWIRALRERVM